MSLIHTVALVCVLAASAVAAAEPPKPAPSQKPADKKPDARTDKKPDAKPGEKTDKDAKDDMVSEEDARKFLAFFEQLVAIVVTNKDDCPKMAAGMKAHVDASQPLLKEMAEARSHGKHLPPAIKEKIAKKSAEELTPALVAKCNKDRGVKMALMRILPPPPGSSAPPEDREEREREREREREGDKDHK